MSLDRSISPSHRSLIPYKRVSSTLDYLNHRPKHKLKHTPQSSIHLSHQPASNDGCSLLSRLTPHHHHHHPIPNKHSTLDSLLHTYLLYSTIPISLYRASFSYLRHHTIHSICKLSSLDLLFLLFFSSLPLLSLNSLLHALYAYQRGLFLVIQS